MDEPQLKSLDELINDQLEPLTEVQTELNGLFKEFDELAHTAYGIMQDSKGYFDIDNFDEEEKNRFIAWHKNFQAAIEKAENLGAIEKGFLDKYQNYTAQQWENDPFWREIGGHYQTLGINEAKVNAILNFSWFYKQFKLKRWIALLFIDKPAFRACARCESCCF